MCYPLLTIAFIKRSQFDLIINEIKKPPQVEEALNKDFN